MASHGVFIAVCGFEHHGPDAHLGFSPRLSPDNFHAPFTATTAWSAIGQLQAGKHRRSNQLGRTPTPPICRLCTLAFDLPEPRDPRQVSVSIQGLPLASGFTREDRRLLVRLAKETILGENTRLEVNITTG